MFGGQGLGHKGHSERSVLQETGVQGSQDLGTVGD